MRTNFFFNWASIKATWTKSLKRSFKWANGSHRTHNLPSGRLKNHFGEVDVAMFQRVERLQEIISYILVIEKSDLAEVA
jgi:hypothetical protein